MQWARDLEFYAFLKTRFDIPMVVSLRGAHMHYTPIVSPYIADVYRAIFPEIKGFSSSNLRYTQQFYLFYNQYFTNLQQVAGNLKEGQIQIHQQVAGELPNHTLFSSQFHGKYSAETGSKDLRGIILPTGSCCDRH